jgi:hypothetical protein
MRNNNEIIGHINLAISNVWFMGGILLNTDYYFVCLALGFLWFGLAMWRFIK